MLKSLALCTLAATTATLVGCTIPGDRAYRISDPDLLPVPDHNTPYEPIEWNGRMYCLYDVDGDLRPDWIWEDYHRLYRPIAVPADSHPFFEWIIEEAIDIITSNSDQDSIVKALERAEATLPDGLLPPLEMTAHEAYEMFVADDGGLTYSLTVDSDDGTADFWLALEAGGGVADPREHPALRFQFGQVRPKVATEDAFNWVRVVGPAAAALDYAVELGIDVKPILEDLARVSRLD